MRGKQADVVRAGDTKEQLKASIDYFHNLLILVLY